MYYFDDSLLHARSILDLCLLAVSFLNFQTIHKTRKKSVLPVDQSRNLLRMFLVDVSCSVCFDCFFSVELQYIGFLLVILQQSKDNIKII